MWTPLATIAQEAWFDKTLRTAADKLNEQIQRLLQRRATIEAGIARVAGTDPAQVDLGNTVEFPSFRVTRCDALQQELLLRRQIAEFWPQYFAAIPLAAKAAAEDRAEIETEIVRGLEQLGFPTSIEAGRAPWLPGVIQSHPRLAAARQNMLGFRARMNDHARERANADAIDQVTREIQDAVAPGLRV